ncbi:BCL2/adenovirus E1B 19 kDa protein-interacting protein 3 isoform X1 [Planococcus citri]|uniref:BCL2/adenovirus E1B 19 kDa protein-interacting protein 3 isoform X1 n=1 Tax=Planococcus citri TaxID=170843 RepID=UPI0031F89F8F
MSSTPPKLMDDCLGGQGSVGPTYQLTDFSSQFRLLDKVKDGNLLSCHSGGSPLSKSWVDLHSHCLHSPGRVTPPFVSAGEEYLRLLKEAQRDSNQSSARISRASSNVASLKGSPKSPPNSPNTEPCTEEDLKDVYINYYSKEGDFIKVDKSTDWIWDWSSRPDSLPPKDWKFVHPKKKTYSMRNAKVGSIGLFSKEVLYTLIVTNFLSIIIGTGVGIWLTKRNILLSSLNFE